MTHLPMTQTIAISCDHAGLILKKPLVEACLEMGVQVIDHGTDSSRSVDYPDFAQKVIQSLRTHESEFGILICGTGIGMAITANRHPFIRAALVHNEFEAQVARQHNNANIICLGGRVIGPGVAISCLKKFLSTAFEGGRHQTRLDKIAQFSE